MKKLVLALCAAVFAVALSACSGGTASSGSASAGVSGSESPSAASSASADSASASNAASSEAAEASAPAAAAVDVSNVDFDVAAMDDAEAFEFMKEFGNRTPDAHAADFGKVMHIKGQVSKYTKKDGDDEQVSYSVGIKGEGGTIWDVNFYVEGWGPDDYPESKAQVEVTGVYGEVEGYGTNAGKTLICNAEDVVLL